MGWVGQQAGLLVIEPVGVVIAPFFAAAVGKRVIAELVELNEREQVGTHANQVALLVNAATIGHFNRIDARWILGIFGILGAELQRAVLVLEKRGRKADAGGIGRGLGADQVLVKTPLGVIAMEPEFGAGHQLVQTFVEVRKVGKILQLAGLADHGNTEAVQSFGEVFLILVAFNTGRTADVGCTHWRVAGDLDLQRRPGQLIAGHRLA